MNDEKISYTLSPLPGGVYIKDPILAMSMPPSLEFSPKRVKLKLKNGWFILIDDVKTEYVAFFTDPRAEVCIVKDSAPLNRMVFATKKEAKLWVFNKHYGIEE